MTREEMQKLLDKLINQEKNKLAANHPMYGEISYDRAANEIFAETGPCAQEEGTDVDRVKAMALMLRHKPE